jgi:hypothetical protein
MKAPIVFLILLISLFSHAQNDLKQVAVDDLPEDIKNIKNVSIAVRWTDSLGDNVIVTTKKTFSNNENDFWEDQKIEVYPILPNRFGMTVTDKNNNRLKETIPPFAYHFTIVHDSAILNWKVVGLSKLCEGDDKNHSNSWFVVTDLDKDAKAEVWLVYRAYCMKDEEHGTLKIVMVENNYRYTITGEIEGPHLDKSLFDQNFRQGAEIFRRYAMYLWKKFATID